MPILGRYGRIELQRKPPEPLILPALALDWPNRRWISAQIEPLWPTDYMVLVYRSKTGTTDFITGYVYHDESGKIFLHSSKGGSLNNTEATRINLEQLDRLPMILGYYEGGERIDYLRTVLDGYIEDNGATSSFGDPYWNDVKLLFPLDAATGVRTMTSIGSVPIVLNPADSNTDYGHTDEFQLFGNNVFKTAFGRWNYGDNSLMETAAAAVNNQFTFETHIAWWELVANTARILYFAELNNYNASGDFAVTKTSIQFPGVGSHSFTWEMQRWYHVAMTRDVDVYQLFVDGQLVKTTLGRPSDKIMNSIDSTVRHGNVPFNYNQSFNGYLANIRYTTAVRYKSDFNPPSAPYPTTGGSITLDNFYTAPTSIRAIPDALEGYDAIERTAGDDWRVQGKITQWTLNIQTPNVETSEVGNRYSTSTNVSSQATGTVDVLIEFDKSKPELDSDTMLRSILLTERGSNYLTRFYISDPDSPGALQGRSKSATNTLLYYETEITFTNAAISVEADGLFLLSADFVSDGNIRLEKV